MNTYTPGQKVITESRGYFRGAVVEGEYLYFKPSSVPGDSLHKVQVISPFSGSVLDLHYYDEEVQPIEHTPAVGGTEVSKEDLKAHLEILAFCVGEVPSGINREEGDRAVEALRAALFPEEVAGA